MRESIKFFMMRHSRDDSSYIDGKNNTSLTAEGIDIAKNAAKDLSAKLGKLNTIINLRSGPKQRVVQTLEILAEQLYIDHVPYMITYDDNLIELFQGNMELQGLSHYDKVAGLHYAWIAFGQERAKGNFNYRFGQPHPEMISRFIKYPYGETHNEFLLRIAKAYRTLIKESIENKTIGVVISHRGGIREFLNFTYAVNNNIDFQDCHVCDLSQITFCDIREVQIDSPKIALDKIGRYIQLLNARTIRNESDRGQ